MTGRREARAESPSMGHKRRAQQGSDASSLILGIDPGLSGAFAIFENDEPICVIDLPTMQTNGKGAFVKQQINAIAFAATLRMHAPYVRMAYVEQIAAMPRQGVASMFSMGHTLGTIQAVLAALLIPYTMVRPQEWKAAYGLKRADKDQSRSVALRLFPQMADSLTRKKDHNRAEALLIGRVGGRWG